MKSKHFTYSLYLEALNTLLALVYTNVLLLFLQKLHICPTPRSIEYTASTTVYTNVLFYFYRNFTYAHHLEALNKLLALLILSIQMFYCYFYRNFTYALHLEALNTLLALLSIQMFYLFLQKLHICPPPRSIEYTASTINIVYTNVLFIFTETSHMPST